MVAEICAHYDPSRRSSATDPDRSRLARDWTGSTEGGHYKDVSGKDEGSSGTKRREDCGGRSSLIKFIFYIFVVKLPTYN